MVISLIILLWKLIKSLYNFVLSKIQEAKLKQARIQREKEKLRILREYKAKKKREKKEQEGKGKSQIEEHEEEEDLEEDLDYSLIHLEDMEDPNSGSFSKFSKMLKDNKENGSLSLTKYKSKGETSSNKKVQSDLESLKNFGVYENNEGESSKNRFSMWGNKKSKSSTETKEKNGKMNLNLLKQMEIKKKLQLLALMYTNLKNFGYWVNAVSFIISYTFIAFTYFHMEDSATHTEKGIVRKIMKII